MIWGFWLFKASRYFLFETPGERGHSVQSSYIVNSRKITSPRLLELKRWLQNKIKLDEVKSSASPSVFQTVSFLFALFW